MEGNEKAIRVNCSFCGAEMVCPPDMMDSEKHMCGDCFTNPEIVEREEDLEKVHIDVPKDKIPEMVAGSLSEHLIREVFPAMWKEKKEELKEMSKKNLAEEMFGWGAYLAAQEILRNSGKFEEEEFEEGSEGKNPGI